MSSTIRRRLDWALLAAVLVICAVGAPNVAGAQGVAASPWPMLHHDVRHTGLSSVDTSAIVGTPMWMSNLGCTGGTSPAIAADGTVYIGGGSVLCAVNPDGTEKWIFYPGGGATYSSPALAPDGTIYVGYYEASSGLYAINPDGTLRWTFNLGTFGTHSSPTVGPDGTIYIGALDGNLYAINPDGTLKWLFTGGTDSGGVGFNYSSPALGADGTVYIGSYDGNLYAVNPDGGEKWTYFVGGTDASPALGADGTIYIGAANFYAINPDGSLMWQFNDCCFGSADGTAAVAADGTIYVGAGGSGDNSLYAFNPDGSVKWTFPGAGYGSPVLSADGTIYIASNEIYAINPDGSLKWQFAAVGAPPGSSGYTRAAGIGADGTVYFNGGYLYAFGPPIIVNTISDEITPGDGLCSLREAISNANSPRVDTTGGDCRVGFGKDTITFSVSGTIALGSTLPAIQNTLTIDGSGQTISVDGANSFTVLIVNPGATLNLDNLTVQHGASSVVVNGVTFGGGILNLGTTALVNSTFSGNSAEDGGGIFSNGSLSVTGSVFSGNSSTVGGGIFNNGTTTISNCTFSGNSASDAGGGIFNYLTNATVAGSTFSSNSAASYGGGIFNEGTISASNSTFFGDSAGVYGGGIFNYLTNATVAGSTFSSNSASAGGGILNDGTTTVSQAILSKNTGGDCAGTLSNNGGYNIADDNTCGFTSSTGADGQTLGDNVNPLLSPSGLQNNGGPTQTIALQSTSPAIAAIPQGNGNCPGIDQRGFDRPAPGYTACDVGAYEFGAAPAACTVTYNGRLKGNLNISSGLVCIMDGTVTGNVTENGGGIFAGDAAIGGNLQITGGGTFSMFSTDVNGDLQIQNIPAGSAQNQICGTHVKGNLTFHNNGTAVAIGTASASCSGDTIGNDLQVNNNTAAVQVFDDSVGGNLQCGNNSTITGGGDTAKSLQGQCAGF
jgi:outer membrane protein assembly factor BamB